MSKAKRQPLPLRGVAAYEAELIPFGGYLVPRGEVIAEMQAEGHDRINIDRFLQGADRLKSRLLGDPRYAGAFESVSDAAPAAHAGR
jgi:hypothetical protein